jgi:SHAQKYF class myb-like DNA-binding protein
MGGDGGMGGVRSRRVTKRNGGDESLHSGNSHGSKSDVGAAAMPSHTLQHSMSATSLVSAGDEGGDDDDVGAGGKKARFVWSAEVHACFCEAVHKLGVDKAKPQAIARLMQADLTLAASCMPTRQNIKSHLQKYRLLLAKRKEMHHDGGRHPNGYHEMPSHANRNANRHGRPNAYSHSRHSNAAAAAAAQEALVDASVDVFCGAMGDDDADDAAAAFSGALGLPQSFDLAELTAPNSGFDFSHLGGSIAAGGLAGSGGVQGTLGGLPMQHMTGLAPPPRGGQRGGGGGLRGGLMGHGISPIEAPHSSFQIHAGGVNTRKRPRDDDRSLGLGGLAQGTLSAGGLSAGGLTQGVLMGGSDDGNEQGVLAGGLGGISSFLAGSSIDGGSIGAGSDGRGETTSLAALTSLTSIRTDPPLASLVCHRIQQWR